MNYRIKIFLYVENNCTMPIEELYALDNYSFRPHLDRLVSEMKWQMFHVLNEKMIDPVAFQENMCIIVEPIGEERFSGEFRKKIEANVAKTLRNPTILIRTKDGIKKLKMR